MVFRGVQPAVMTPFGDDDAVRTDVLTEMVSWYVDCGVDGIVGIGSMGEFGALSTDERRTVIAAILEAVDGRVPLTVGVSADTAAEAAAFAVDAAAGGVQGLMALPPLVYDADDDEKIAFYAEVAPPTSLPLMVYNHPAGGKGDLTPELLARLCEIENVVAVKESSGDARRIAAVMGATGGRMEVIAGTDDVALESFAAGATGWVSGCIVAAPEECVELWRLLQAGDFAGGAPALAAPAPARPAGHASEARPVLQGVARPGRPLRRPEPPAAPAADGGGAPAGRRFARRALGQGRAAGRRSSRRRLIHHVAARHVQRRARVEAAPVGGEEDGRRRNLLDAAEAAERHLAALLIQPLLGDPVEQRRLDRPRRDRVDVDVVRRELVGQSLREPVNAGLRRRVVRHPVPADQGELRAHVDDPPGALGDHRRQHGPRAQEHAREVDVDHVPPRLERHVDERAYLR